MKKELRIFFTAVMFLTRIRVPKQVDHDPAHLQKSAKYFPLIGWIVGGISALVFLVFNRYLSANLAILSSMVAGILITGAFHEDGFADSCDAFGGGWTKEKILAIMKDSRLGTYGVIGLIAILSAKFILIQDLPRFTPSLESPSVNIFYNYRYFIVLLIAAHSSSRLMPVFIIQFSEYVTDPDSAKSRLLASRKLSWVYLTVACISGLAPLLLLPWVFSMAVILQLYLTYSLTKYFRRWIGGYTGDCLGAVQQVTEIAFYLAAVIIWQYIL